MKTVAVHEALHRLSELLAEVERGEEFTITRHGEPVARIVAAGPVVGAGDLADVRVGAGVAQAADRVRLARRANEIVTAKREGRPRAVPLAGELLAEVRDGDG